MKGLTVGIIGCGLIGQKRAAALRQVDTVAAVFDSNPTAMRSLVEKYGAAEATTIDELFSRQLDAVIVATEHAALADYGERALRAGADVLIEKPGGRTTEEVEHLVRVSEETGRLVFVGFNHRFHPGVQRILEEVQSGMSGELLFVRARYGHGGRIGYDREWRADPHRSGGGELVDQGFHLIDLTRCLAGELPLASVFTSTVFWDMEVDDNAVVILGTSGNGGPFANLHASCSEWKNLFDLEVYCQAAKFHLSGLQGSYGQQVLTTYRMKPELGPPDAERIEYPMGDISWQREWEAVAAGISSRCVESGDLASALYCHRIADAAYGAVPWR